MYKSWALADEVLFALPEPVTFLQRLHQIGFDSFFSFLKHCRFFSIWKGKAPFGKGAVLTCWIRKPRELAEEALAESDKVWLRKYAQAFFEQRMCSVGFGVPTLLRHFANSGEAALGKSSLEEIRGELNS